MKMDKKIKENILNEYIEGKNKITKKSNEIFYGQLFNGIMMTFGILVGLIFSATETTLPKYSQNAAELTLIIFSLVFWSIYALLCYVIFDSSFKFNRALVKKYNMTFEEYEQLKAERIIKETKE